MGKSKKLSRRKFVGLAAVAAGAVTAGGLVKLTRKERKFQRGSPPNFVFFLADDLSSFELSCYNRGLTYSTPMIDKFAEDGVLFTQAYSAAPVCIPTRAALMTGHYPHKSIPYYPLRLENVSLPTHLPRLPALLKKSGYSTALVGKWHLGLFPERGPLRSGYDEFFGIGQGQVDYFNHRGPSGRYDLFENETPVVKEGYLTDLITDKAIEFCSRKHNNPFFLSVHYTAPHAPFEGPEDIEISRQLWKNTGIRIDSEEMGKKFKKAGNEKAYVNMIRRMDEGVGRILETISKNGLEDNTVVVFTSDNGGTAFSQHKDFFRAGKARVFEGGIRVPCLLRWPFAFGRKTCDDSLITMDLTRTILNMAGENVAAGIPFDGIDFLPVLTEGVRPVPRTLFWRHNWQATGHQGAARREQWKFVRIMGREFLFDLSTDPQERVDVSYARPEVFKKLKDEFDRWLLPT